MLPRCIPEVNVNGDRNPISMTAFDAAKLLRFESISGLKSEICEDFSGIKPCRLLTRP